MKPAAALGMLWLLLGPGPVCGKERRLPTGPRYQLRWEELAPLITGARIALELPGGVRLRGLVLSVEPDALTLRVSKTSDRKAYEKGRQSVPRAVIRDMKISKSRGMAGRVIGTTIGAWFGLPTGIGLAVGAILEGAYWGPVIAGIITIPPALGYLLGRQADRREMFITVEGSPASDPAAAPR